MPFSETVNICGKAQVMCLACKMVYGHSIIKPEFANLKSEASAEACQASIIIDAELFSKQVVITNTKSKIFLLTN